MLKACPDRKIYHEFETRQCTVFFTNKHFILSYYNRFFAYKLQTLENGVDHATPPPTFLCRRRAANQNWAERRRRRDHEIGAELYAGRRSHTEGGLVHRFKSLASPVSALGCVDSNGRAVGKDLNRTGSRSQRSLYKICIGLPLPLHDFYEREGYIA